MATQKKADSQRRRQQILDGALGVFASKGCGAATIKDIAVAAGIASPALIYHYFADKADVLRQLIDQRVPVADLFAHADAMMALPPRELLPRIATLLLRSAEDPQAVALMKLMLGESLRQPDVALAMNNALPGRGFAFLHNYMERQMAAGRLRRVEPGVAVCCFIGPLIMYILTRDVFVQPDSATLSIDAMAAGVVETFLRGMAPE